MEAVIVDSGGANLASLRYALERLGARTQVSNDARTIASAARVVLPGVGAAAHAMERLHAAGLTSVLRALTQPVLGVCLGMQLLFKLSEEGLTECLGVLPYAVRRLRSAPHRPVPHMGWNQLCQLRPDPLLEGVPDGAYAYFVHSYAAPLTQHTDNSGFQVRHTMSVPRPWPSWQTEGDQSSHFDRERWRAVVYASTKRKIRKMAWTVLLRYVPEHDFILTSYTDVILRDAKDTARWRREVIRSWDWPDPSGPLMHCVSAASSPLWVTSATR